MAPRDVAGGVAGRETYVSENNPLLPKLSENFNNSIFLKRGSLAAALTWRRRDGAAAAAMLTKAQRRAAERLAAQRHMVQQRAPQLYAAPSSRSRRLSTDTSLPRQRHVSDPGCNTRYRRAPVFCARGIARKRTRTSA